MDELIKYLTDSCTSLEASEFESKLAADEMMRRDFVEYLRLLAMVDLCLD